MRRRRWPTALLIAVIVAGCTTDTTHTAAPPLPPDDGLPTDIETMLFGDPSACREAADCVSTVCHYGACGGLLSVDARHKQNRIADVMAARAAGDAELRRRLVLQLGRLSRMQRVAPKDRARLVIALERLGAADILRDNLADYPEAVAEVASVALARLGDPAGEAQTLALTEAKPLPTATEAVMALGALKSDLSLGALLSHLTDAVKFELQRAALIGLAARADARAVRPLITYLGRAPGPLRGRALRLLAALVPNAHSADGGPLTTEASWRDWVATTRDAPADPPAFTVRTAPASDSPFSLPAP